MIHRVGRAATFGAASLAAGLSLWTALGLLAAVARDDGIDYIFVPAPAWWVAPAWAFAAIVLGLAIHSQRAPEAAPRSPVRSSAALAGWSLALLLPVIVFLVPAAGEWTAFWYVIVDLRWFWWTGVAVALLATRWPPWLEHLREYAQQRPGVARAAGIVSLAAIPVACAIVTTPHARFGAAMGGDEPKYLRYCENFYQGLGFEISSKRLITDPAAVADVPGNVRQFIAALGVEVPLFTNDVRRLFDASVASGPTGGEPSPGLFFDGKHPGHVYQLHNPGLSFILFPGYYVDRRWTGSGIGYQEEFPESLPAVNATLLALFAGYGLSVFALLRRVGTSPLLAWGLALLMMVVLPVESFAFQIYPEIAAGIVLCLVAIRRLSPASARVWPEICAGLLAGSLPWLHVRFGLATVLLAAWTIGQASRPWRARAAFLAGAAAGLATLSAYAYRLTGSFLPLSTYGADAPITIARLAHGLPGFLFDGTFGLFAHAPIFLLAIPGATLLWIRRRDVAVPSLLLTIGVAAPAAAHGFWAAGATPARYLVAVMPLVAIFLAESLSRWRGRRTFGAAVVLLAGISIETAIRYNLDHRDFGKLIASGFSGWRPNLLFPSLGVDWYFSTTDWLLFTGWVAVCAMLLGWPLRARAARELAGEAEWPALRHVVLLAVVLVAVATPISVATGRSRLVDYQPSAERVRERAFRDVATRPRCRLCASSRLGQADPAQIFGNDVATLAIQIETSSPVAGRPVFIRLRPRDATGAPVLGDVLVDLGDGTSRQFGGLYGDVRIEHIYASPGDYRVQASISARGDGTARSEEAVAVGPASGSWVR